ncbi:MAG: hypothetical protein NDI62_01845 [Burkholderiales bacterium]|nr:hypothetical protein [Burkholderiales bacterium]
MKNGWHLEYFTTLGLHSLFLEIPRQQDHEIAREKAKKEMKKINEKQKELVPSGAMIVWKEYRNI